MTEERMPNEDLSVNMDAFQEQELRETTKKKMHHCFNRIGWSIFTTLVIWMSLLYTVTFAVMLVDLLNENTVLMDLYNQYLLVINEFTLAMAIVIGFFVIQTVPETDEAPQPISFGHFMRILCICFAVSYIGNIIGTLFLSYWGMITGNEVGNELEEVLNMTDPLMMFLSVGVLAPLLEELVFRKFLIDRMRPYGELVSILVSAGLFALFHQNFSQFIYTFSAGIMLGYLYYKTGNYWLTTLLHAIFNCLGGVVPTLLAPKVLEFSDKLTAMESQLMSMETYEEMVELLLPLTTEYATPIMIYSVYLLFIGIINIAGIIFLILGFRKYRAQKPKVSLTVPETFRAIFKNPGMICTVVLLGVLTFLSLFMM